MALSVRLASFQVVCESFLVVCVRSDTTPFAELLLTGLELENTSGAGNNNAHGRVKKITISDLCTQREEWRHTLEPLPVVVAASGAEDPDQVCFGVVFVCPGGDGGSVGRHTMRVLHIPSLVRQLVSTKNIYATKGSPPPPFLIFRFRCQTLVSHFAGLPPPPPWVC